jgi:hypothetical protein
VQPPILREYGLLQIAIARRVVSAYARIAHRLVA